MSRCGRQWRTFRSFSYQINEVEEEEKDVRLESADDEVRKPELEEVLVLLKGGSGTRKVLGCWFSVEEGSGLKNVG